MARVETLIEDDHKFRGMHPTKVACKYLVGEHDGKKILQLNSYGSDDRQVPDKLSQTLQFDEQSARELFGVLVREYGFKGN